MAFEIKEETIESFLNYYDGPGRSLDWPSVFTLPAWLRAWWESFGEGWELCLQSVWQDQDLIGLAPLMCEGKVGRLIGSIDLCDYLDFVVLPQKDTNFFQALLPALRARGIEKLELEAQHPAAYIFNGLFAFDAEGRFPVQLNFSRQDLSFELPLPESWEGYLTMLKKKQRHEVRRKLRRLENESNSYRYRVIDKRQEVKEFLPRFINLFGRNPEKANFLTEEREQFFYRLLDANSHLDLARFGLLEIDGAIAAAVLYFDYRQRVYLYNSGYVPDYGHLSAGLLSKVLCLKHSIENGVAVFDFLKGAEVYKSRLGAKAVPVYKVTLDFL